MKAYSEDLQRKPIEAVDGEVKKSEPTFVCALGSIHCLAFSIVFFVDILFSLESV